MEEGRMYTPPELYRLACNKCPGSRTRAYEYMRMVASVQASLGYTLRVQSEEGPRQIYYVLPEWLDAAPALDAEDTIDESSPVNLSAPFDDADTWVRPIPTEAKTRQFKRVVL